MSTSRLGSLAMVCMATFMAGMAAPVDASVPLAERPLYLGSSVKPAFIMAVDDSGSMQWDILSSNQNGELVWGRDSGTAPWGFFRDNGTLRPNSGGQNRTGDWVELFPFPGRGTRRYTVPPIPAFGFARSPAFNPGYYDPAATFSPWLGYDGTPFESMDTPAEWQSMKLDTRSGNAIRYDLTNTIYDRSDDGANTPWANTNLVAGNVLRAGWRIQNQTNGDQTCNIQPNPATITFPQTSNAPLLLTTDVTMRGDCTTVRIYKPDTNNNFPDTSGNGEMFNVREGMVIPSGTEYWVANTCGGLGTTLDTMGTWVTLGANATIGNTCDMNNDGDSTDTGTGAQDFNVGFAYFAPTYYLTTNTSPDGNTAPTTFTNLTGGPRSTTTPGNGTLYRYEIRPGNYPSPAAYRAAMTNFANWFLYYRTRNLAMVAALTRSLNDVDFMRIGYFEINAVRSGSSFDGTIPNVVMHEMSDFTNSTAVAGRRRLYGEMIGLPANGSTPNGWAVNQMGLQFMRTTGTTSPESGPPVASVCQFNAGMLFTDGYSNQNRPQTVGNVDGGAPFNVAPFTDSHSDTMADIASYYYRENVRPDLTPGLVPVPPGCAIANPDPKLDCNRNLHMTFYGITLGATGAQFGVNYQQDPDTLLITPDIYTAGNAPPWTGWANDAPSAVDDIWHATVNTRGQFINATSPEKISQAMNAIIQAINNAARRSAGTAASGARRTVDFTAYVPEFDPNSWTGDVKAYRLLTTGALGPVAWSAVERMPAPAARNIRVSIPNATGTAFTLQPFTLAGLGTTPAQRLGRLGLTEAHLATGGSYDGRTEQEVIDYLRGDPANEGSAAGQFRRRVLVNPDGSTQHRPIGDILGSQPEVLQASSEGYSFLPVSQGGRFIADDVPLAPINQPGTYSHFVNTTKSSRTPVLVVGSNDGMIHGFNAATSGAATAGQEVFAVMPNSVLQKTGRLLDRNYAHTFLADGSPRIADACIGGTVANCSWKTVAVAGMGVGGRSVIALDVTNPVAGFTNANLLWEFSHLQNPEMGFTLNRPRVFVGEGGGWYAAFGNGLNSASHKALLFIVDLRTGAQVASIQLGNDGSAADPNGAIAVAAVDGDGSGDDFDGYVDTLYVTDFHGNLWKVKIPSYSVNKLYTAQALDNAEVGASRRQFVTGGIDVGLHPLRGNFVYFGTGRYVAEGDQNVPVAPAQPQVQSFYAIWDDPENQTAFVGRANLGGQSIIGTSANGRRQFSANPVLYTGASPRRGWFVDLYQAGVFRTSERVLGTPVVESGSVLFTAFQPIGTECNPGGRNWLYSLSAVTGVGTLVEGLDSDGTGTNNLCHNCGGVNLNPDGQAAPPTPDPPIVTNPPQQPLVDTDGDGVGDTPAEPGCIPGTPGCEPLPAGGASLSTRPCIATLNVLLPNAGLTPFTQIPCGRQAWRQVE